MNRLLLSLLLALGWQALASAPQELDDESEIINADSPLPDSLPKAVVVRVNESTNQTEIAHLPEDLSQEDLEQVIDDLEFTPLNEDEVFAAQSADGQYVNELDLDQGRESWYFYFGAAAWVGAYYYAPTYYYGGYNYSYAPYYGGYGNGYSYEYYRPDHRWNERGRWHNGRGHWNDGRGRWHGRDRRWDHGRRQWNHRDRWHDRGRWDHDGRWNDRHRGRWLRARGWDHDDRRHWDRGRGRGHDRGRGRGHGR